jgi:hypothetical protein
MDTAQHIRTLQLTYEPSWPARSSKTGAAGSSST